MLSLVASVASKSKYTSTLSSASAWQNAIKNHLFYIFYIKHFIQKCITKILERPLLIT